jgi:diguanylate cyclase (GGDEF)-like protein
MPCVEGDVTDPALPADAAPSTDPSAFVAGATSILARWSDLDAALAELLSGAAAVAGAGPAALFVRDPETGALQLAASTGFAPGAERAFAAEVTEHPEHPIAVAAREGRPAVGRVGITPDGATMTGVDLPLVVARDGVDLAVGVVAFGWPGARTIDDATLRLLTTMADLAALAVDRARLASLVEERSEWLARVAGTDALTGLASRRTLDRVLELEIARAERLKTDVSLVVVDVDAFRATNAEAGAAAGDDVLRSVAAVLAEHVRLVDTVARIGGDEFAVVAPGSGGVVVARRVLDAVDALGPVAGRPVTISAGIARFPVDGASAAELLSAALAALEAARDSGAGAIAEVRAG